MGYDIMTDARSPFAEAYYLLDNENHGDCGLTERQRVAEMIKVSCGLSDRTLRRLLAEPDRLQLLSKAERVQISIVMNIDVRTLFKK